MQQGSDYLDGVEWSGWPIDDAHNRHSDPRRQRAGFIYVSESTDGWIKVGRANNVRKRMRTHAKEADLRGASIARVFASAPHADWWENESELIAYCTRRTRPGHGKEYFRGLDFSNVVKFAKSLPQRLLTMAEIAEREAEAQRRLDSFIGAMGQVGTLAQAERSGEDLFRSVSDHVGHLFGRAGASYRLPVSPSEDMTGEELWGLCRDMADAKGMTVEDLLKLNWMDILTDTFVMAVQLEAKKYELYARENGHEHVLESLGDHLARLAYPESELPDDDEVVAP